ncbi:hypothetical protein AB0L06_35990 [Spirillospora sp. NPDC052269]
MATELDERLSLFEPLLDELATMFCPSESWSAETPDDPGLDAYERCEIKRLKIGEACAADRGAVREHADQIMRAIAHDHNPSGNRQLIEPLVRSIGARQVMERVLGYLETGLAAEKLGAAMAWYWAVPSLRYATMEELRADLDGQSSDEGAIRVSLSPRTPTPADNNAEVRALYRHLQPRFRIGCLRAFVASNSPEESRYLSYQFSLNLSDYPPELHAEVEAAARIVTADPEQYRNGSPSR